MTPGEAQERLLLLLAALDDCEQAGVACVIAVDAKSYANDGGPEILLPAAEAPKLLLDAEHVERSARGKQHCYAWRDGVCYVWIVDAPAEVGQGKPATPDDGIRLQAAALLAGAPL